MCGRGRCVQSVLLAEREGELIGAVDVEGGVGF